jgi:TM2 domain-containing membrane protein YozV
MDADFASTVLTDLYRYSRKRQWLARLLWVSLGWFGAHRFYLGRYGSALLMLFTAGGFLVWWIVDAFLIGSMVGRYNGEQE